MSADETEPTKDKYGISLAKPTQERWDDLKVRDQIGIFADVERNKEVSDASTRANMALLDVGEYIQTNAPGLKDLHYQGSAAVHIYLAPTLGEMVFVTQVKPLRDTAERIAGPAFTQLQKDMMAQYGRKTTKVRSGF
jgi:hypothetical protein